jgi:hypothetical protein
MLSNLGHRSGDWLSHKVPSSFPYIWWVGLLRQEQPGDVQARGGVGTPEDVISRICDCEYEHELRGLCVPCEGCCPNVGQQKLEIARGQGGIWQSTRDGTELLRIQCIILLTLEPRRWKRAM